MALHNWVSAPHVLEGRARDCIVAVLSWPDVQRGAALMGIQVNPLCGARTVRASPVFVVLGMQW
jgi:hypothetical protein